MSMSATLPARTILGTHQQSVAMPAAVQQPWTAQPQAPGLCHQPTTEGRLQPRMRDTAVGAVGQIESTEDIQPLPLAQHPMNAQEELGMSAQQGVCEVN